MYAIKGGEGAINERGKVCECVCACMRSCMRVCVRACVCI